MRALNEPAATAAIADSAAPSTFDREKLDNWCERGVIGLVLAILIYAPLATGAIRPQDFVVVQWLVVPVLLLWALRFWINPQHRLLWPPMCWAVVGFMAYAVGRYFFADVEYTARQEVAKVLVYGFLFLAILHNLHRLETVQFLGLTLITLATGIAMYGIVQYLTSSDHVWHFLRPGIYHKRGSGTFINPNHFAGFIEMLLPLAIAYTLTGRFGHVTKIFLGYACLVLFAGLMVSVSRGAWIASGVALVALFFWLLGMRDYRFRGLMVLIVFAVIATGFVLRAELSQNRRDSLSELMVGENFRFQIWKPAMRIWKDHFWAGAGPGHFDHRFRQYREAGRFPDQMQVRPERVHNDYLNTLADWGLIGALLVAAAFALFYWDVFRGWKYVQRAQNDIAAKRSSKAAFVMGGALGLIALLMHSVTDYNMHLPANAILVVTLLALVAAHFRYTTEGYWHTVHATLRVVITVLLVVSAGWLAAENWKRSREWRWLKQAESEPYYSVGQIAALEKAFAIEPRNFETAYLIGEGYRMHSWEGGDNYKELAQTAMKWFQRTSQLNPYDPYALLRYGMCLHWIGRHDVAQDYFDRALKLDPNGYYTVAHMGWHYVQLEEWAKAKEWFERSRGLFWANNPIATSYLEIVNQKLAEERAARSGQ